MTDWEELEPVTQRVAVGIAGEDELIRRQLIVVEHAMAELVQSVNRPRAAREERQIVLRPGVGLGNSARLRALRHACDSLCWASQELTAALVGSGTMTDEIPF